MKSRNNRDFTKGPVWDEEIERYRVEILYPDGSRLRKRFCREREANRFWATEQAKIDQGSWNETRPKNLRLGTALDEYRQYCQMQHRSYVTYMKRPLDFWEERFGRETLVAKITKAHIEQIKLELASKLDRSTVNKYLAVLKAFLNWLILQGQCHSNPVKKIKLFSTNNEIVRYLDAADEYPKLLEEAAKIRWYLPYMIKLAVHTGLRKHNLLHLQWNQCDFKTRTIRIAQDTKNQEPVALPMNDTVIRTLQELKEKTGAYEYVFAHRKGRDRGLPIQDVKNSFASACEKAGIENFRWHDMRHTFASWLVPRCRSC
ncbi:MAG: site-specific integrase [Acidobacteria bacterium]|nr:site-specific integrase [Acidobacteriota bacterium]